ncbi:MAG: phenylalanine--tRNA ligase subunit alpha [Thermoanaerobaculia bacterium]
MEHGKEIDRLLDEFRREAEQISSRASFEALKGRYLGRPKGLIPGLFKNLPNVPGDERAEYGSRANAAKDEVERILQSKAQQLARAEAEIREMATRVDATLPGRPSPRGALHPITAVRRQIERVFLRLGFSIADGPELETDFFNFEALNFPPDHPARDTQDTLLVRGPRPSPGGQPSDRQVNAGGRGEAGGDGADAEYLLRTHTSPVQIRALRRHGAPIRVIAPGRVYRKDEVDATHSPVFHQIEGLVVDRGITMAHLKGTIEAFLQGLFGAATKVRFTCSYFPFVEPGAQAAMTCFLCRGAGCRACKGSGWIEILGAGMVHPSVLRVCGVDPEVYSGFAFGTGIDRLAFLKYAVPDLRLFWENDLRFLEQFRSAV